MSQADGDVKSIDKTKYGLYEPGFYHVVLINDNFTPMDFVVEVLIKIYCKSEADAMKLMMKVHNEGQAIAGTYVEDIALTKSELTNKIAKDNGFPLKTKVQPA